MFYLGRMATWQAGKAVLSGNCKFIELKRTETIDVDSEEDWKLLEMMYKSQHGL
jgi:CMP-N-acetylneuraminic acid synthetase